MNGWRWMTVVLLAAGCAGPLQKVKKPPAEVRAPQNEQWLEQIRALGRPGDWLVIRGYKPVDDLVVAATRMPLSHAAVLDPASGEIIEAVGEGVKVSPLEEFVDHSHRVLLIRPKWWSEATGADAVEEARAVVGKRYDFLGTVGLPSKKRYYCSELATWVYRAWHGETEHLPKVVEPGQMYLWGTILFDSGTRD